MFGNSVDNIVRYGPYTATMVSGQTTELATMPLEKKIIILINLPVEFLKIQGHGWKVHIFPVAGCQILKTEVNMKQSQRDWLQHRKFRPSLYNSMETAWNSAHQLNTSRLGLLHLCDITTFVSPWSLLMAGKWPYCHLSLSLVQLLIHTIWPKVNGLPSQLLDSVVLEHNHEIFTVKHSKLNMAC